jgi:hypothetical protein
MEEEPVLATRVRFSLSPVTSRHSPPHSFASPNPMQHHSQSPTSPSSTRTFTFLDDAVSPVMAKTVVTSTPRADVVPIAVMESLTPALPAAVTIPLNNGFAVTTRVTSSFATLKKIVIPVSAVAGHVLRVWYRTVRSGVRNALQLRSDWREGQAARRKIVVLMRARAEERIAAKKREQQAMNKLAELEAHISHMQQSVIICIYRPPTGSPPTAISERAKLPLVYIISVFLFSLYRLLNQPTPVAQCCHSFGNNHASAIPILPTPTQIHFQSTHHNSPIVPQAPPMTGTVVVPMAPPMAPSMGPGVHSSTMPPVSNAAPANRPSAASLQSAAGMLRSIRSAVPAASMGMDTHVTAGLSTASAVPRSTSMDLSALREVKLKSSHPIAHSRLSNGAQSNSSFLLAALQNKFQRSGMSHMSKYNRPIRVSMGGNIRPFSHMHPSASLNTPAHSSNKSHSAFSPMTPAGEQDEQWTPAR